MATARQEVERRLIAEYMSEKYTNNEYWLNYPLGPLPKGMTDRNQALPWLRKVDGLAIVGREVHLIEAKIWTTTDGLDKLIAYAACVPHTPWLGEAKDYPTKMILVAPRANDATRAAADVLGIVIDTLDRPWVREQIERIEHLWTKEGRMKQVERRKILDWLGL
jgi:hypothetical protein